MIGALILTNIVLSLTLCLCIDNGRRIDALEAEVRMLKLGNKNLKPYNKTIFPKTGN